jgi:hypothetical protein
MVLGTRTPVSTRTPSPVVNTRFNSSGTLQEIKEIRWDGYVADIRETKEIDLLGTGKPRWDKVRKGKAISVTGRGGP